MFSFPELSRDVTSMTSSSALPDVFVIPPEDEYDSPPWCCFDAKRDAQPGAFMEDEFMVCGEAEYGNGIPADSSYFDDYDVDMDMDMLDDSESQDAHKRSRVRQEDMFAMRNLVHEAENIRVKLKALDLTVQPRARVDSLPVEFPSPDSDMDLSESPSYDPETTATVAPKVKKSKSFFSFGRKKSQTDIAASSSTSIEQPDSDAISVSSSRSNARTRKTSLLARLGLTKKATEPLPEPPLQPSPSSEPKHAEEQKPKDENDDAKVKRRFSFFEAPQRRFSVSTQNTVSVASPTASPSMVSDRSETTSTVSSVPETPDASPCILSSPVSSPTSESGSLPPRESDEPPSLVRHSVFASMDAISVNDFASSLSFPEFSKPMDQTGSSTADNGAFTLDPLHFESLQFDSDAFA